jgi:hypothetical protein
MIKRYFAAKDNTISNAFEPNLTTRAVSASMGQSDILEVFSIYGQVSSSSGFSTEEARVLIEFDLSDIQADIASGVIPSNAKYYLRLFNAEHGSTLPREFDIEVHSVSDAWQEGLGLDMESYKDLSSGFGSNWTVRSGSTAWSSPGGDVHANTSSVQSFPIGTEDLNVDVTTQVSAWLNTGRSNEGFLVKLPTALTGQQRSYYTKKFFARGTEFFHKRPCLEVRWDSSIQDDRINFYASSSLAPAADNINTLYLYNYHRGQLANIPTIGEGEIYVNLYETLGGSPLTQCIDTPATGGYVSTGVYTASVCLQTTASTIHDVWHSGSKASTILTFGTSVPSNGPLNMTFGQVGAFTLTFDNTAGSTDAEVGIKSSAVLTFGPIVPSNGSLEITFGQVGTFTLTFDNTAGSTDADIGSDNAATIDPSKEVDSAGNAQRVLLLLRDGVTGDVIKNAYDFSYDGSTPGGETVTITAKEKGLTHDITVAESLDNISSVVTSGPDNTATIDPSIEGDSAGNAQRVLLLLRDGVNDNRIKNAYDFSYDGSTPGGETVTITAKEKGPLHNIAVTESLNNVSSTTTDGVMINYHTGTIDVEQFSALTALPDNHLVVSVSNNRSFHYTEQTSRFYFYIRQKKWSPAIYTTATTTPTTEVFENLHFKITKVVTNETIFDYDTTNNSTLLSYDSRGNYFDLDIGMLEPNYTYQIELALYNVATKTYEQLSFKHKFRVVNNEY